MQIAWSVFKRPHSSKSEPTRFRPLKCFFGKILKKKKKKDAIKHFKDEKLKHIYLESYNPFNDTHLNFLPYNSLGLRHNGRVVARMITEQMKVLYICHFMTLFAEPAYAQKGVSTALVYKSVALDKEYWAAKNQVKGGMFHCMYDNLPMWKFTKERIGKNPDKFTHFNKATIHL